MNPRRRCRRIAVASLSYEKATIKECCGLLKMVTTGVCWRGVASAKSSGWML
jgi:hypothetical protein